MSQQTVGRGSELAATTRFLDSLSRDGPVALVLVGEAGIGKTTLWEATVRQARERGYHVLSCRPAESEARLTFAGLGDLLSGVPLDVLSELPAPQRLAIDAALLRADPGALEGDWRAAGMGFLSALKALAALAPVVVAVDDVQWLDPASIRVIEFAARRLSDVPVGLLFCARASEAYSPPPLQGSPTESRVHRLEVGPMTLAELYRVVESRLGIHLGRVTLRRLEAATGGNPLHTVELARALHEAGQLSAPPETLPLTPTLAELVEQRIARLQPATRRALLAAALSASPTLDVVRDAEGPEGIHALERAQRAGVVDLDNGRVRFTHPLLASAVASGSDGAQRRRVHARLAALEPDPEARARHAALAVEGTDADTAAELSTAAAGASARGAPDAAADLARLALRLTPLADGPERHRRAIQAAEYLFVSGDPRDAEELLDAAVAELEPGPDRARAHILLARIAWVREGSVLAQELLEKALEDAQDDLSLVAAAHSWAAEFSDLDEQRRSHHARTAVAVLEGMEDPDPARLAAALKAYAESELVLGGGLPREAVERAIELEASRPPARVTDRVGFVLGWWLVWTDELVEARERLENAHRALLAEGTGSAVELHGWLRELELHEGNFLAAAEHAEEQLASARQQGEERWAAGALARKARVYAHLGRAEEAAAAAREALTVAEAHGDLGLALLCEWALGFLAFSSGELTEAATWLGRADATHERIGLVEPGYARFHADHVETLIGLGRIEDAETLLSRLETRAEAADRPSARAGAARCRALLFAARGQPEEAARALVEAFRQHDRAELPFERARTLLVQGQILRRTRQKRAARESLTAALAIFERLPAPLWVATTRAEIERIGLRRGDPTQLTDTEQRVAELAALGLRNREIAARAFLSPKSVEDVLSRVYRKLGIRSRAELGARMAAGPRDE